MKIPNKNVPPLTAIPALLFAGIASLMLAHPAAAQVSVPFYDDFGPDAGDFPGYNDPNFTTSATLNLTGDVWTVVSPGIASDGASQAYESIIVNNSSTIYNCAEVQTTGLAAPKPSSSRRIFKSPRSPRRGRLTLGFWLLATIRTLAVWEMGPVTAVSFGAICNSPPPCTTAPAASASLILKMAAEVPRESAREARSGELAYQHERHVSHVDGGDV